MDVTIDVQMVQPGGDVLEERIDFLELQLPWTIEVFWWFDLVFGPPSDPVLQPFRSDLRFGRTTDVLMQVSSIAILLENKSTRYTRTEVV